MQELSSHREPKRWYGELPTCWQPKERTLCVFMHAAERPTCSFCGEVLGVYEPIVAVADESERHTSLARDPQLRHEHGTRLLHRNCFLIEQGDPG